MNSANYLLDYLVCEKSENVKESSDVLFCLIDSLTLIRFFYNHKILKIQQIFTCEKLAVKKDKRLTNFKNCCNCHLMNYSV